jgi:Zn-dependent protease
VFKLFRIPIQIDLSWLFVFVLVIWSLAVGLFPSYCKGVPLASYKFWLMGFAGSLGLFISLLFHELSHSLVAVQCLLLHSLSIQMQSL